MQTSTFNLRLCDPHPETYLVRVHRTKVDIFRRVSISVAVCLAQRTGVMAVRLYECICDCLCGGWRETTGVSPDDTAAFQVSTETLCNSKTSHLHHVS